MTIESKYPLEDLDDLSDDGTMPDCRDTLAAAVVGHRIIGVSNEIGVPSIHLDNGTVVRLIENADCCAYTELTTFLLHADKVRNVITAVGTTEQFSKWFIVADMTDVLELEVSWSGGNVGYYTYGFSIKVEHETGRATPH